jgi:hypothetical protein
MKKMVLIIPYFGTWPFWIDLYFYSVRRNPCIDIILFTDCPIFDNLPPNVIIKQISFEKYCKKISDSLAVRFNPSKPYKLCDVKPFYGFIHQEELTGYDFWGFGDIDLIYGNLSKFFTSEILKNYDIISSHQHIISGHFALLRNNEKIRNLPFQIKDWQNLLEDDKNNAIDEIYFSNFTAPECKILHFIEYQALKRTNDIILTLKILSFLGPLLHSISRRNHKCRMYFKEQYTTPKKNFRNTMRYIYNQDGIFDEYAGNREIPYLHFLFFKKKEFRDKFLQPSYFLKNNRFMSFDKNIITLLDKNDLLIDSNGFHIMSEYDYYKWKLSN